MVHETRLPDYERPRRQFDLLSLELGLRDSALVEVADHELASLAEEFGTVRVVLAGAARHGSDARLHADDQAMGRNFAIVSRRPDLPPAAWFREVWEGRIPSAQFDGEERDANQIFGRLLGYPDCCIEWWRTLEADPDVVRSNLRYAAEALARTSPGRRHFGLNWLLHDYVQLVSHRPCSFSCGASIAAASRFFALLQQRYPTFANELRATLGAYVLFFDSEDYVAFTGQVQGESPETIEGRIDTVVRRRHTDAARRSLYDALGPGVRFSVAPDALRVGDREWPLKAGRDVLVAPFDPA